MIDLDNLITAIIDRINDTGNLSSVHGKAFLDVIPEGITRPDVRISLIEGTNDLVLGESTTLDTVMFQFGVFHTNLAIANALAKGIANAFVDVPLALTDQKNLRAKRRGSRVRCEGKEGHLYLYHSMVDLEFLVQA